MIVCNILHSQLLNTNLLFLNYHLLILISLKTVRKTSHYLFLIFLQVITWTKIREYLQTVYPENIRDFETVTTAILVYVSGLCAALYLQLFHDNFTSFFLLALYDTLVFGFYLILCVLVGANINRLTNNHKSNLGNHQVRKSIRENIQKKLKFSIKIFWRRKFLTFLSGSWKLKYKRERSTLVKQDYKDYEKLIFCLKVYTH